MEIADFAVIYSDGTWTKVSKLTCYYRANLEAEIHESFPDAIAVRLIETRQPTLEGMTMYIVEDGIIDMATKVVDAAHELERFLKEQKGKDLRMDMHREVAERTKKLQHSIGAFIYQIARP